MRYVVALNYQQFSNWCREQLPPINPTNPSRRDVIYISTDVGAYGVQRLLGHRLTPGDEVIKYGQYARGKHLGEVLDELKRMKEIAGA